MCKVTVYIPTHNYGRFVAQAVESVRKQTLEDWELIIINDGSTDETAEVLAPYEDHPRIRVIHQQNQGLAVTNNIALRLGRGEYIMRLDGDDYLDENLLLVLSNVLDTKPDIGLVYPDYYLVSADGEIIEQVRRKKIDEEVFLLDLPAHGACTMFRRDLLVEIGGYLEDFACQDGYELWLRFIRRHKPFNVNLPLFYYRQHAASLTRDQAKILETRRRIKEKFARECADRPRPTVLGVVLAGGAGACPEMHPLRPLAGQPMLAYTLSEACAAGLDRIVLSSDDPAILTLAEDFPPVEPLRRGEGRAAGNQAGALVRAVLQQLKKNEPGYRPDLAAVLYANTPLRKAQHISKAIDTYMIFDVDTVISIVEELAPCYQHRQFGLTPLNDPAGSVRLERRAIYKENGAIYLTGYDDALEGNLLGKRVGHITMLPAESVKINTPFDFWMVEQILLQKQREKNREGEPNA
jgi:CMP-N-acetylneuraminic acid synthetase